MLLTSAEQCIAEGCLKAVFIFIKRTGNWGLLSSLPARPAAEGVGEPPLPPPTLPVGTGSLKITIRMLVLVTAAHIC